MASGRKKILWVDDEIEFLRSHIMFLETRGYSVIPVFCGDDAIQLIHQNHKAYDIVLLDEQMPGKGGLATLEEIKDFVPDLPVVMVTKSEEEQLMEDALGKKIDGYLTKPVNPSQILLICKKLLDSKQILSTQITQKFIRSYSQNRTTLSGLLKTSEWIRMYEKLVSWDIELEKVDDEGLRQTHAGQKSDYNASFSDLVIENYARWIQGKGNPPPLASNVLDRYVFPLLETKKKVVMVVLSGMRLDQYTGIEQILRSHYTIKRQHFFSILPSSSSFSRNALFSGMIPLEIAERYPEIWTTGEEGEEKANRFERELLGAKMHAAGYGAAEGEPYYTKLHDFTDAGELLSIFESCKASRLITFVVNFFDLLLQNSSSLGMLQEITNDESGLRHLTTSWFQRSALLQVLRELASRDVAVVITSDHGNIHCSRGTELYGVQEWGPNLRFKFGTDISSDERRVVYLADPSHFGLPSFKERTNCIIAKENYYFIHSEKFEHYQKQYRNSFQQGGISMEEVIMPLGVFES